MNNNAQSHLNQIIKKERMFYLDLCNRNLEGNMDLSEFKNLKTLNASNNKFTNLDFLNSLPNKEQLISLNFFGNELKDLDLTLLLENFPNLKMVNLDNNPLSLKNLNQLSTEKLALLVDMVENKKIKVNTWKTKSLLWVFPKGALTLDLLKALQELKGNNNSNQNSHSQSNQRTLNANYQSEIKPNKDNNNLLLLIPVIAGSVLVGSLFTYLWLKGSKKNTK